MIQELNYKWKTEERQDNWTGPQQWRKFKTFYCNAIKEYDINGMITAKPRRANSIVNQEAINQQTLSYMDNMQEQLDK